MPIKSKKKKKVTSRPASVTSPSPIVGISSETTTKDFTSYLNITLLILFAFILLFIVWYSRMTNHSPVASDLTPQPLPHAVQENTSAPTLVPIPSGKQTFTITTGRKNGPKYSTITVNPYDPQIDTDQIVATYINSIKPVSSASLTLYTDNQQSVSVPLKLTAGNSRSGTWSATLNYTNTYNYIYKMTFVATDSANITNQFDLILR